jgi:hypothetical protein
MHHDVRHLSDQEVLAALTRSVARSNEATADLLVHLGEAQARELYLAQACSSMFAYCVERLHLSEGATYKLLKVARAARQYPVLLEMLAKGELHLSGAALIVPLLTPENHLELLARAKHRSKRAIEVLVAELQPRPDAAATVRKLPSLSKSPHAPADATLEDCAPAAGVDPAPALPLAGLVAAAVQLPSPPAQRIEPTAKDRYKVTFTADEELHDLLHRATDLLGHQVPSGDIATVVARALRLLVDDLETKKTGRTKRAVLPPVDTSPASSEKGPAPRKSASRHIPRKIRREVWARDEGRCTFTDESGHRCSATRMLEYDHLRPFAAHREHEASVITLRCRHHHRLAAERYFGKEHMDRYRRRPPADAPPASAVARRRPRRAADTGPQE